MKYLSIVILKNNFVITYKQCMCFRFADVCVTVSNSLQFFPFFNQIQILFCNKGNSKNVLVIISLMALSTRF